MFKNLLNVIVLTSFFSFMAPLALAVEVEKLDQADITVESRSRAERSNALKQALADLFIKNSGHQEVVMHPLISEQINRPEALLTQYTYREVENELVLQAVFDHQQLIQLLRQADLPVWGAQRPLTLIWMSMPDESGYQVLSDMTAEPIRKVVAEDAENKGIPLLFPLMDLDDLMQVSVTDIRGQFANSIAQASERYDVEYFAIGNLDEVAGQIRYQVSLFEKGGQQNIIQPLVTYQAMSSDYENASQQVVDRLTEYFVGRYAIASSGEDIKTLVSFTQVENMKDVVEIEAYLTQSTAVKSFSIHRLQHDIVSYQVELFSQIEDFERFLNISNQLTPVQTLSDIPPSTGAPLDGVEQNFELIYQWRN
ncbi:DUF2066 domain-containing protein [Shewanella maritima]|uniref:DUF2066 domain-containing protein n=1 Tax=Shewanella maritima TaxID=2520507 RepID=UPI00373546F6